MPDETTRRLGLTIPLGSRLDSAGSLTALAEQGYTDFWTAETSRFDAFTPLAAARIFVCCSPDTTAVRAAARRLIAGYLSIPGYAAFHRWLGRTAALAPMWDAWTAGDRKAAVAAVPDEVVDDLIVHGTAEECAAGLRTYSEAGVDIPIVKLLALGFHHDLLAEASAVARSYRADASRLFPRSSWRCCRAC
jgi:alkanesulfonate monooxygenase SsuD/methylene tetrahydromethanopterin reductase-like flavin-dependent oxidoreductase (luciferase family)